MLFLVTTTVKEAEVQNHPLVNCQTIPINLSIKAQKKLSYRGLECPHLLQVQYYPPPRAGPDQAQAVWGLSPGGGLRQHPGHRGGQAQGRQAWGLLWQSGEHHLVSPQLQVINYVWSASLYLFTFYSCVDVYLTHLYHLQHLFQQQLQLLLPQLQHHPLPHYLALARAQVLN